MGNKFRDSLHFGQKVSTEHLNRAQAILATALEKRGHESLTDKNFHEVMEHARKDPRWHGLYSSGSKLEDALRAHLKIPSPERVTPQ